LATLLLNARHAGGAAFNPYVHGARGLFAAQLLVFHVLGVEWPLYSLIQTKPGMFFLRVLEYGVELFFCVSGYVMVQALGRAARPVTFLRDRALRILPLLCVVVLVSILFGLLDGKRAIWLLPGEALALLAVANMLPLPGIFPVPIINPATWTLSYEFVFYFGCALWLALQTRGSRLGTMVLLVAAAVLFLVYPRGIPFLVGVLVGCRGGAAGGGLARYPALMILAFLAGWALMQALSPTLLVETHLWEWVLDARVFLAVLALACLYFGFSGLVAGGGALGALLISRPLQVLGTISYSFYLWQNAALGAARRILKLLFGDDPHGLVNLAAYPILTFAILLPLSLVSWRLIEVGCSDGLRAMLRIERPQRSAPAAGA
jgi:peptidoglycan/LPS O-acetylase OafA/YrhL